MIVGFRRFALASATLTIGLGLLATLPGRAEDRTQDGRRTQSSAALEEGEWGVVDRSGEISFRRGNAASWRPLATDTMLGWSSQVKSGGDGWALLARGKDTISIAANTRMALPSKPEKSGTLILQSFGSMRFKIDKRPGRDFWVVTPYLIAGVKGTAFGVSVDDEGTSVSVSEGTVGVSATAGAAVGDTTDVTAGQTASIGSAPESEVALGGTGSGKGRDVPAAKGTAPGPIVTAAKGGKDDSQGGDGDGGDSGGGDSGGGESGAADSGGGDSGDSGGGDSGGGDSGGDSGSDPGRGGFGSSGGG